MRLPRHLGPVLGAAACLAGLAAFITYHDLHTGTLRVYGGTTDVMPYKETLFFVALAVLGGAATFFLTLVFARARAAGEGLTRGARAAAARPAATIAVLATFAFVASALVSWLALQHSQILLDEMLYGFQADLLRGGHLTAKLPDPLAPFRDFYSVQTRGIWTGIYPWGHVAALLPGYLVGLPQLVPHLCAAAAVVLTYGLGRELFDDDPVTPLAGAAMVALSPFVAFTCGTIHNATTSMVLVNLGLWGLARGVHRSSAPAALVAGLAFGLGLHSRPLNAVGVALPAGMVALFVAVRLRRRPLPLIASFLAGLLPGLIAYCLINKAITGDPLVTPAVLSMPAGIHIFGFGENGLAVPHTPTLAFGKAGTNLIRLLLWSTGSVAGALGLLGLVAGLRRRAFDLVLLVPVGGIFGLYYFFFTSPAYDTGPLYYLDLVPVLGLALGRSLVALVDRLGGDPRARRYVLGGAAASVLVAFASFWPLEGVAAHRVTDNTLLPYRAVEEAGIHHAVVWFNWNPYYRSWTLPPRPPRPDLSDDVLYARFDRDWAGAMWKKYSATRTFYTLVFEDGEATVVPWFPPWLNRE